MSDWSHEYMDRRAGEHRDGCPAQYSTTATCTCRPAAPKPLVAAERPPINHHRLGCHSRRGGACDCPPATSGGDEVSVTVVLPEPPAHDDSRPVKPKCPRPACSDGLCEALHVRDCVRPAAYVRDPKACAHATLSTGRLGRDECLHCVDCRAAINGTTKQQIHLNGVPVFLEPDWAVPTIESRGPVLPQHQHPLLGPDYVALATEIGTLVTEKQAAYGDSFGKSGAVLRILYPNGISLAQLDDALTITRILDKLFRIATDKDAFGESPFKDIVGYGLLAVARSKAVRDV